MKKTILILICVAFLGCEQKDANSLKKKDQLTRMLSIVIDMSGSFEDRLEKGKLSYRLIRSSIGTYFHKYRNQSSLIISTIDSRSKRSIVWQGQAREFGKDFSSEKKFFAHIRKNIDASGSNIYSSLENTITHMLAYPPEIQKTVMVLSDMWDNSKKPRKDEFYQVLTQFKAADGEIAFYFVDQTVVSELKEKLESIGYSSPIVVSSFQRKMPLPNFGRKRKIAGTNK